MLWAARDDLEELYGDVLAVWRGWADDLRGGRALDCGHHLSEEAPQELAAELRVPQPTSVPRSTVMAWPPSSTRSPAVRVRTTPPRRDAWKPTRSARPRRPVQ